MEKFIVYYCCNHEKYLFEYTVKHLWFIEHPSESYMMLPITYAEAALT